MKITIDLKVLICTAAALTLLGLGIAAGMVISPAQASIDAQVGYVDSQQALRSHPQYQNVKAQVDRVKEQKLNELAGYSNADQLTDAQRQQLMDDLDRIQGEIDAEAQRLFEPIIQDVLDATTEVGTESGISVIVEKDVVLYGGLNLTPVVIQKLTGQ